MNNQIFITHFPWFSPHPPGAATGAFLRVRRALRPAQQRRRVAGGRQQRGGLVEGLGQVVLGTEGPSHNGKI